MNVKPSETAGDAERAYKAVAIARGKDTSLAGMRRREIDHSERGESLAALLTPCSAVRYTVRAPDRLSHVVLDEQHDRSIDHARSPPMKPSANAVTRTIPRGWRRRSRSLINGHSAYMINSCAGIYISSTRPHLRNFEYAAPMAKKSLCASWWPCCQECPPPSHRDRLCRPMPI
jgi:hypothetical protein